MFAPWALQSLPPLPGCKQQVVLGFPAPGYYAAAMAACGGQQLSSTPAFVSEGQPVCGSGLAAEGHGVAQPGSGPRNVASPPASAAAPPPPPRATAPSTAAHAAAGVKHVAKHGLVPAWVRAMLQTSFFGPCDVHRPLKKNECTFFCSTCATGTGLCQHCVAEHAGHQVIQIRRYVYCDVVRAVDIAQFMDTAGVQCYIINQAKVMFLNPRPQSKIGRLMAPDTCRSCARHLREGYVYCCLACKVAALESGDAWLPAPGSVGSDSESDAMMGVAQHPASGPDGGGDDSNALPADGGCSSTSSDMCMGARRGAAMRGSAAPLSPATLALLQAIHTTSSDDEVEQLPAALSTPLGQAAGRFGVATAAPNATYKRRRITPPTAMAAAASPVTVAMLAPLASGQSEAACVGMTEVACGGSAPAAPVRAMARPPAVRVPFRTSSANLANSRRKQNSPRKSAV